MMNVPFYSLDYVNRTLGDALRESFSDVLDSKWFIRGSRCAAFEEAFAAYCGKKACVGVGNGLDALTLMLKASIQLGRLQPGDEVIVPANTYIASILSITENQLTPVLVEPRMDTLQIDDTLIEQAITPRTRAILLVHLYGRCAYSSTIERLCEKHHLKLVEDNAQAHGCRYEEDGPARHTGSLGHAAAHSFYPGKNLGALGDAGAVTTDDDALAELVRALGNYGSSRKYVFPYKGRNSRMDELQAAALRVKLKYLDQENERRRAIADVYYRHIDNPHVILPGRETWLSGTSHEEVRWANVFHIFPVLSPHRDALQQYLKSNGVGTMIHYPIPPHQQQCYAEWNERSLPLTEEIHQQELSLPCNQSMTDEEVEYVVNCVNAFVPETTV